MIIFRQKCHFTASERHAQIGYCNAITQLELQGDHYLFDDSSAGYRAGCSACRGVDGRDRAVMGAVYRPGLDRAGR